MDLCEFETSLVYTVSFQDSQSYVMRPCLKTAIEQTKMPVRQRCMKWYVDLHVTACSGEVCTTEAWATQQEARPLPSLTYCLSSLSCCEKHGDQKQVGKEGVSSSYSSQLITNPTNTGTELSPCSQFL